MLLESLFLLTFLFTNTLAAILSVTPNLNSITDNGATIAFIVTYDVATTVDKCNLRVDASTTYNTCGTHYATWQQLFTHTPGVVYTKSVPRPSNFIGTERCFGLLCGNATSFTHQKFYLTSPPWKVVLSTPSVSKNADNQSVTTLEWTSGSPYPPPASDYTVWWTLSSGGPVLGYDSGNTTSRDIIGLTWLTNYTFYINATNSVGTTVSNPINATIVMNNCGSMPCPTGYNCEENGPGFDCCRPGTNSTICDLCPPNSFPDANSTTGCTCDVGYFGDALDTCTPVPPKKVSDVTYTVRTNADNQSVTLLNWTASESESPIQEYTLVVNDEVVMTTLNLSIEVAGLEWFTAYNFTIITTAANNANSSSDPIEAIIDMKNCDSNPCASGYDCIDRGPNYDCCRPGALSVCVPCPLHSYLNSTAPFGCTCESGYEEDGISLCSPVPEKVSNVTYTVTSNADNQSITTVSWNVPSSISPIIEYTVRVDGGDEVTSLNPTSELVGLSWFTSYNITITATAANNKTSTSDPIEAIIDMRNCDPNPCSTGYDCIDQGPHHDCCRPGGSICSPCPFHSYLNSTAPFGCTCESGYEEDGISLCSPVNCPSNSRWNASSPTSCTCLPLYRGDGATCVPCSAFSEPNSQVCTCPINFQQVGDDCLPDRKQDYEIKITLQVVNNDIIHSPDFPTLLTNELSTALLIPPAMIQIISITHPPNPEDPAQVTILISRPSRSMQGAKSPIDVTSNIWAQLNDPDSALNHGNTTGQLVKTSIHVTLSIVETSESEKLSVVTLVLVLGIPLVTIAALGYFNHKFFPGAKAMRLVTSLLSLISFAANAYFVYTLYSSTDLENLGWEKTLATVALVLPLGLNPALSSFHISREGQLNDSFAKWAEKSRLSYYMVLFLSVFGVRNVLLLSSGVFGLESMSAPIVGHREGTFNLLGIIGNVVGDIPMIIAQIGTGLGAGIFHLGTIVGLVFTLANLAGGVLGQGWSSHQYKQAQQEVQLEKIQTSTEQGEHQVPSTEQGEQTSSTDHGDQTVSMEQGEQQAASTNQGE